MSLFKTMLFSAVVVSMVGCGSSSTTGGGSGDGRAITGTVPQSSGGTTTRAFGGVTATRPDALRVAAYKLHPKGEVDVRIEAAVGVDGHFRLVVPPVGRYVVAIESDAGKNAALLTFAGAKSVLDLAAAGADLDVGALALASGIASSAAQISAEGATAAAAAADEYFTAADGALQSAKDAIEAAAKAAQVACDHAKQSLAAAEEACTLPGANCGSSVDLAREDTNAQCDAAKSGLGATTP
jgi:hypothetical protein